MTRGFTSATPPEVTPVAHSSCDTVGVGELLTLLGFVHERNGDLRDCPAPGSLRGDAHDPCHTRTGSNRLRETGTEMLTDFSKAQYVLVVGSDPAGLARLHQQFGNNGTTIDKVESVSAGSRLISSNSYDLAIMNLGCTEDCALVKLAVSKGIPVVVVAAHQTSPATMMEAARLGARACLLMRLFAHGEPFDQCLVTMQSALNSDWIHRI